MKIVFKLGDFKVEIPYESKLWNPVDKDKMQKIVSEVYKNKSYPLSDAFSDSDLKLLKETYEKFLISLTNYYKDIGGLFEKYAGLYYGQVKDRTDILPANGHDIYNYVARYGIANFQLQAIMKLEGRIDFNKLCRAVRLSVDAEPVFGCRFVEGEPPYWKRLDDLDHVQFCFLEETGNVDEAVQQFIDSPLDMDHDPKVQLKVIRSEQCDTLVAKVNHACCDGTGVKEYIRLLADIYSCIDHENGVFVPKPRMRSRKDQDRLLEAVGISDLNAAFVPGSEILLPTWPFPWKQAVSNHTHVGVCRLSPEQFGEMTDYAKSRGATINDLILAAFYRAMQDIGQPIYGFPMEIPITVDLRRYLPDQETEAIRNFSGSVNARLSMVANETFDETLSRVVPVMKDIKKGYPGLQSAIGLERIEKLSFRETLAYYQAGSHVTEKSGTCPPYCGDKCVPTLSNLGVISKSILRFGRNTVTDAYIVPPVLRAPGLLLMVSTYNGVLTLSAGYYESTVGKGVVEKLLKKIKSELLQGADDSY